MLYLFKEADLRLVFDTGKARLQQSLSNLTKIDDATLVNKAIGGQALSNDEQQKVIAQLLLWDLQEGVHFHWEAEGVPSG